MLIFFILTISFQIFHSMQFCFYNQDEVTKFKKTTRKWKYIVLKEKQIQIDLTFFFTIWDNCLKGWFILEVCKKTIFCNWKMWARPFTNLFCILSFFRKVFSGCESGIWGSRMLYWKEKTLLVSCIAFTIMKLFF